MITTARKTFIERAAPSSAVRVDHERGIIRGAKLVGTTSDNGRKYPLDVLRAAVPLYEHAKLHVDHPKSTRNLERSFSDWVGIVQNVRLGTDGLFGDLKLRKSSAAYAELMEAAELFPESFGLSHVAFGDSRKVGGIEVVETIDEVISVDIVTTPATTAGLFESRGRPASFELLESRTIAALRARIDDLEELAEIEARHARMVEQAQQKLDARRARYRR